MEPEGLLPNSQKLARSIQSMPQSHLFKMHFNIILQFKPGFS
jgi:hypothetical protein